MRTLPFANWYLGLALCGRPVNRDAERTDFAQRKAGRGIRIESIGQRRYVVRTVSGEPMPITKFQRSWSI